MCTYMHVRTCMYMYVCTYVCTYIRRRVPVARDRVCSRVAERTDRRASIRYVTLEFSCGISAPKFSSRISALASARSPPPPRPPPPAPPRTTAARRGTYVLLAQVPTCQLVRGVGAHKKCSPPLSPPPAASRFGDLGLKARRRFGRYVEGARVSATRTREALVAIWYRDNALFIVLITIRIICFNDERINNQGPSAAHRDN